VPEKLDQWHDFRKSVALVSMVLFFFCVVGLGFLVYQLAIVGDDRGVFDPWSFLRAMSVTVPLGVAVAAGIGVYRAGNNAESKRRGRVMALALLVAAILLVVTGIIKDGLS
jgi:Ni/Fe-hydrogenase subunit HybB-like protein